MDEFVDVSNPEQKFMFMLLERIVDLETRLAEHLAKDERRVEIVNAALDELDDARRIDVFHRGRGVMVQVVFDAGETFDPVDGPREIAVKVHEQNADQVVYYTKAEPYDDRLPPSRFIKFDLFWTQDEEISWDPMSRARAVQKLLPFKPVRILAFVSTSPILTEGIARVGVGVGDM